MGSAAGAAASANGAGGGSAGGASRTPGVRRDTMIRSYFVMLVALFGAPQFGSVRFGWFKNEDMWVLFRWDF